MGALLLGGGGIYRSVFRVFSSQCSPFCYSLVNLFSPVRAQLTMRRIKRSDTDHVLQFRERLKMIHVRRPGDIDMCTVDYSASAIGKPSFRLKLFSERNCIKPLSFEVS